MVAHLTLLDRGYGKPIQGSVVANLPALPDPKSIDETMTHEQAARAYADTVAKGRRDLDNLINGDQTIIDVTPNKQDEDAT